MELKAASDGDGIPLKVKLNPRIGAPFGASWNDYPNNEQIQVFLTGMLADSIGLFAAANFAMLLLCVLSALSFYFVCRQFHCAWQWAFAMALVFAFSQFVFAQGQAHHLTVAACWHILLMLGSSAAGRSIGGGLQWQGWRFRLSVAVAILAGVQNIYYAAMFIQLLGIGCARSNSCDATGGESLHAVAVGTVMTRQGHRDERQHLRLPLAARPESRAIPWRSCEETEWTATKFADLFMPWQHVGCAPSANWAQNYFDHDYVHGEKPPASYLGIVGIVALGWFLVRIFRRIAARPAKPLPLGALQFAWVFLFATVGGVNGSPRQRGFILFRASDARYSIILLCILLLLFARRLFDADCETSAAFS